MFTQRNAYKHGAVTKYLFLSVALFALGCSDPIVGKWEGRHDDAVDLDVTSSDNADYEGEGHIYMCGDSCMLCPFDFEVTETAGGEYDVEGEFSGPCSDLGKFDDIRCELTADDTELRCDIQGSTTIEYDKVE